MNKKIFVGAVALMTVVIGGVVYYRWVQTKVSPFVEDDFDELDEALEDEPVNLNLAQYKQPELKVERTDG